MSKYLASRGHDVTVFSFTGSHYLLLKKGGEINRSEEIHEGVKFKWLKSIQFQSQNLLIRIINWQWYNMQLKNFLKSYKAEAPDSIVYSIPALHQLRLMPFTKSLFPKARHVFEIQDIWPLSVQDLGGYSRNNIVIKRLKQAEQIGFNNADEVIAVQPRIHEYVENEFSDYTKGNTHFIPHAYTPENMENFEIEFDIGYAGTLSRANDIASLINALTILKDEKQFEPKVLIIGSGLYYSRLKKMAVNLLNIKFISWIPREETLKELSKCRICYDGLLDLDMYKYGFSRLKWVDYMMLKKPILASYSGAKIDVEIEAVGWQVPAQSPKLLASEIYNILKEPLNEEIIYKGKKGFNFLNKNRHIEKLGKKYEQILLRTSE